MCVCECIYIYIYIYTYKKKHQVSGSQEPFRWIALSICRVQRCLGIPTNQYGDHFQGLSHICDDSRCYSIIMACDHAIP